MNVEYQRLEAEAREVEGQIGDLVARVELHSPSDHARFEQQNAALGQKLASLRHGMALIRAVNSAELRKREREFIKSLSKKYHSQGMRAKVIHLPEGVTVTLSVTGRILRSLGLECECRCDASCLLKEFFGTSRFDPSTQSNDCFGVIA